MYFPNHPFFDHNAQYTLENWACAPAAAVEWIPASVLAVEQLSEFDSEFPWLSPACFDKWKFSGSLSGSSTHGTFPSILTPPPHHLLVDMKNDQRVYSGLSVLDWKVERTKRVGVALPPVDPESTLGANGLSKFTS